MARFELRGPRFLGAVLALTLAGGGTAWPQKASIRFKVVNATPDEIREVYVCPTGAAKWGPNLLPAKRPLAPGKRLLLSFAGDCGQYDIRLVAPGGKEYMDEELSFCEDDDVVTIGGGELKKAKSNAGNGS
jgi:hypothetical protein